jgi:lipase chaperone LimK
MNRTLTLATVILIGLAGALAFSLTLLTPDSADLSTPPPAVKHNALPSGSDAQTKNGEYPSRLVTSDSVEIPAQFPASLEGTDVPSGWDKTDANGSLVPTPELRHLFEHFLAALGEESLAQLIARIQMTLLTLQEPARSEAIGILGAYLDYKLELGGLEVGSGAVTTLNPEAMVRQFSEIRSLRRHWLDADTAEAFFAMEEAVDDFQLARMRIRADEALSDEARAVLLQEAEQALPAPIRDARQQTRKFTDYQQMRQELSDDPEALQAWRREAFGDEAAQRLTQVEVKQKAWDENWQVYQQEKAVLEKLGLAGPERKAALTQLREQFFDGPERYRAEALDSIQ